MKLLPGRNAPYSANPRRGVTVRLRPSNTTQIRERTRRATHRCSLPRSVNAQPFSAVLGGRREKAACEALARRSRRVIVSETVACRYWS